VRRLSHGTTIHGQQFLDELGKTPESLAYYHPNGPMGQGVLSQGGEARIGIVGLGVGALACHATERQKWTFFEIDGEVDRIARDPALFSYMSQCGAAMPTILGDARLELARAADLSFDLLIIDAFSSDAIPIHLMTVEALELYRARLAPDGVLMFHVTNRFFHLSPVLGRAASDLGMTARIRVRTDEGELPLARGEANSVVVALSPNPGLFAGDSRWKPLADDGGARWTDDHASLLSVLRF
jgi:spermidine synthase